MTGELIDKLDEWSRTLSPKSWQVYGRKGPHLTREAQLLADAADAIGQANGNLKPVAAK